METMRQLRRRKGFSLVEVLVVIMIIAMLMAILLPTLRTAREQAKSLKCKSNLRQIYASLMIYSNTWRGWMFPPNLGDEIMPDGTHMPKEWRWPAQVFKPPVWNPPVMICPSDEEPAEEHSYVLNNHLANKAPKFTNKIRGKTDPEVVLMGEKKSDANDYYMEVNAPSGVVTTTSISDFFRVVEKYRHGLKLGSNYLFKDGHVTTEGPSSALAGIDPWDVPQSAAATMPIGP
jgi:prepilin-type N-terminal cleavage/methylation domain-containing protein/prepilin-type processing-associated H-X9-DG protein